VLLKIPADYIKDMPSKSGTNIGSSNNPLLANLFSREKLTSLIVLLRFIDKLLTAMRLWYGRVANVWQPVLAYGNRVKE
jgi:hypothetical protein